MTTPPKAKETDTTSNSNNRLPNEQASTEEEKDEEEEEEEEEEEDVVGLTRQLEQDLTLRQHAHDDSSTAANSSRQPMTLLCDLGYGIPKESRPRKEKILAISKQLVNFLTWQNQQSLPKAKVQVVSCPDQTIQTAIQERMKDLWNKENANVVFPNNFSFSPHTLEMWVKQSNYTKDETVDNDDDDDDDDHHHHHHDTIVYLSPDADQSLEPTQPPPRIAVIGLLIDRRTILVDKSKTRAATLQMTAARWPLDRLVADMDPSEPLNVDCILEGMQQWDWNYYYYYYYYCQTIIKDDDDDDNGDATIRATKACANALIQALEHHAQRHPERPIHKQIN